MTWTFVRVPETRALIGSDCHGSDWLKAGFVPRLIPGLDLNWCKIFWFLLRPIRSWCCPIWGLKIFAVILSCSLQSSWIETKPGPSKQKPGLLRYRPAPMCLFLTWSRLKRYFQHIQWVMDFSSIEVWKNTKWIRLWFNWNICWNIEKFSHKSPIFGEKHDQKKNTNRKDFYFFRSLAPLRTPLFSAKVFLQFNRSEKKSWQENVKSNFYGGIDLSALGLENPENYFKSDSWLIWICHLVVINLIQ